VRSGIDAVLDYAEAQARAAIADLPDGSYTFHDYMEGDVVPGGQPIRVKLTMHIAGDDITLDFAGTDPWVNAALNMPTHSKNGHWMIAFALISFLRSTRPEIPFNSGMVRPIRIEIPKGTFLNPPPLAAVGVRAATMFRVFDTVVGALTQAVPDLLPAAGSSQGSILLVSAPDVVTGETRVSVVQPLCGGSGGRPTKDGTDGVDTAMGFLRNIPVESIESDIPILITRYKLREDSGGPGRFRGGVGSELGFRVLGAQATITSRGMERYRFAPWGRDNGSPGTTGITTVNPGRDSERDIGKIDVLVLNPGEEVLIRTQGGGGFGSPFERDPDDVLRDVRDLLVSVERAESDYGVVIRGGEIDAEATARLRSERAAGPLARITYDDDRAAYDATWSDGLRAAVNEASDRLHGALRHMARSRLMVRIDERAGRGETVTVADVGPMFSDVLDEMGLSRFVEPVASALD
jgi:N-methylhydantoinase B